MTETTRWTVCHNDWDDKVNGMYDDLDDKVNDMS